MHIRREVWTRRVGVFLGSGKSNGGPCAPRGYSSGEDRPAKEDSVGTVGEGEGPREPLYMSLFVLDFEESVGVF